jgi:hypothetical protein
VVKILFNHTSYGISKKSQAYPTPLFQGVTPLPEYSPEEARLKALREPDQYLALEEGTSTKKGKTAFLLRLTGEHQRVLLYLRAILKGIAPHPASQNADMNKNTDLKLHPGSLSQALEKLGASPSHSSTIEQVGKQLTQQVTNALLNHPKDPVFPPPKEFETIFAPTRYESPLNQLKQILQLIFPINDNNHCLLGALSWAGTSPEAREEIEDTGLLLEQKIAQAFLPAQQQELPSLLNRTLHYQPNPGIRNLEDQILGLLIPKSPSGIAPHQVLSVLSAMSQAQKQNQGTVKRLLKETFTYNSNTLLFQDIAQMLHQQLGIGEEETKAHLEQLSRTQMLMCYRTPDPFESKGRWEVFPEGIEFAQTAKTLLKQPEQQKALLTYLNLVETDLENRTLLLADQMSELTLQEAQYRLHLKNAEEALIAETGNLKLFHSKGMKRKTRTKIRQASNSRDKAQKVLMEAAQKTAEAKLLLSQEITAIEAQLEEVKVLQMMTQVKSHTEQLLNDMHNTQKRMEAQSPWKNALDDMFESVSSGTLTDSDEQAPA